jgi:hypothetical protein
MDAWKGAGEAVRRLERELQTEGAEPLDHPRPVEVWLHVDGQRWRGHVYARRRDVGGGWRGLVAVPRQYAPGYWSPYVGWLRQEAIELLDGLRPVGGPG